MLADSTFDRDLFGSHMFVDTVLFLLLKAAKFRSLAQSCLLFYRDMFCCIPQQFNETLYSQFAIFCLAAGLLRYYPQDAVLANVSRKAAHHEFLLLRREVRRVSQIEPKRYAAGYLVDVMDYLIGGSLGYVPINFPRSFINS